MKFYKSLGVLPFYGEPSKVFAFLGGSIFVAFSTLRKKFVLEITLN